MKVNNNIVISVGQAGNQIAAVFWKTLCQEHGIDPTTGKAVSADGPIGCWSAFFSNFGDMGSQSYVPRALLVDLEPSVVEEARSQTGNLFNPFNLITSTNGAGGNFATGYLGEGLQLTETVLAALAVEFEKCDNIGGIILIHSLGGGTGSGLGSLLIRAIKEHHPEALVLSVAIFPSPQVSSVVTEPYNTIFALNTLCEKADACLVIDNEALFHLAHDKWGMEEPHVDDLNILITDVLAGLTAPMRFSGFLTVEISLRELITNLVPKPSLHFLMVAFAPLSKPEESKFADVSVEQLIDSLFEPHAVFAACSPMQGRFMSSALLYRGQMDDRARIDSAIAALRSRIPLTSWIPTAFKIGYVEQAGLTHRKSVVLVANNTEISRVFERIAANFDKLWQRKAFANWYLAEGMTEDQINEMRQTVSVLMQKYQEAETTGGGRSNPATITSKAVAFPGGGIKTVVDNSLEVELNRPSSPARPTTIRLSDLVKHRSNG